MYRLREKVDCMEFRPCVSGRLPKVKNNGKSKNCELKRWLRLLREVAVYKGFQVQSFESFDWRSRKVIE